MVQYSNGRIYKIICDNDDSIYIGSCSMDLRKRLSNHKMKNSKCSSKYLFEQGDCDIILIEKYPCNDCEELRMREQYWMNIYKKNGFKLVNSRKAYLTVEQIKESKNQYKINNKERKKELNKKSWENNKWKYKEEVRWISLWKSKKRLILICDYINFINSF